MQRTLIFPLAFLLLLALTGCATTGLAPIQQEQQDLNVISATATLAETAYGIADAAGVVPAQDEAIAQVAITAVNAGLAQAQAAVTAGDTNGYQIAVASIEAALGKLVPIINTAAPKAAARLRAARTKP